MKMVMVTVSVTVTDSGTVAATVDLHNLKL